MNLSPRWCVTAFAAVGALSCSDPVPPPAQGAFIVTLSNVSPSNGKSCPAGTAFTYDVPSVLASKPTETLSSSTYLHWTVDGESNSKVSCSVKGSSSFSFSGRISSGVQTLEISDGVLTNNMSGTARFTVANGMKISNPLTSPAADCTVTVVNNSKGLQVKPGSLWATFTCSGVEHQPGEACQAKGTFVLENCTQ